MITQDQWNVIHHLRTEGRGIREIARYMKMSRNTVRSALKRETFDIVSIRVPRVTVLSPFAKQIPEIAMKTGYNAQRVYEELRTIGYKGSYQQVMRAVRPLREAAQANWMVEPAANPGQNGHVYWGTTQAWIGETKLRVHVFLMVLGYSGMFTGRFVLDETIPTFLNCHEIAFQYFNGVPNTIFYENPKKMVVQFDANGFPLEWEPLFRKFLDGVGVEPSMANQEAIPTKGKIMAILNHVKKHFLRGRQFANLNALNANFEWWRDEAINTQAMGGSPIRRLERFREEQQQLLTWDEKKWANL